MMDVIPATPPASAPVGLRRRSRLWLVLGAGVDPGDAKDADCTRTLRARPSLAQDRAKNAKATR